MFNVIEFKIRYLCGFLTVWTCLCYSAMGNEQFKWGVCGHPGSGPYNEARGLTLSEQFGLIKEVGCSWYRFDVFAVAGSDELDSIIPAAEANGVKVLPMVYPPVELRPYETLLTRGWTLEQIYNTCYNHAYSVAVKWKGKVEVWDMLNEPDGWTILAGYHGDQLYQYDATLIDIAAAILRGQADGFHAGDPNARVSLNTGGWFHYGFVDHMISHGVNFDILQWHWYDNMGRIDKVASRGNYNLLAKLLSYNKPVWIGESNALNSDGTYDPADEAWLIEQMSIVYKYRYRGTEAYFIYELLDEPDLADIQGHFGIVDMEKMGSLYTIGTRKPVFYRTQNSLVNSKHSDGSVFKDVFDGVNFNLTKWNVVSTGAGILEVASGNAHFQTRGAPNDQDAYIVSKPVSYNGLTETAAEIRFKVDSSIFGPLSDNDTHPTLNRQVQLLTGRNAGGAGNQEYAVSLLQTANASEFSLGWGCYFGVVNPPVVLAPGAENLYRDTWYTLVLHHRNDGEIEFFLDGVSLGRRIAFAGLAETLFVGDASGNVGAGLYVDYIRAGNPTTSCISELPSDLNHDCYVDFSDLSVFLLQWMQCTDPANINCE